MPTLETIRNYLDWESENDDVDVDPFPKFDVVEDLRSPNELDPTEVYSLYSI